MDYKEYKNAKIYTVDPIPEEVKKFKFPVGYGGVLDEFDNFVEDSSFMRNGHNIIIEPIKKINIENKLFGKYIYGGFLYYHYGHFILETLSRIWYYQKEKLPILFISDNHRKIIKGFKKHNKEIFKIIGIEDYDYKFINENTLVENLIVPTPKVKHGPWLSEDFSPTNLIPYKNKFAFMEQEYIDSISKIDCKENDLKYKVWMSRSQLKHILDNDPKRPKFDWVLLLEEKLKNLGWIIFHPQNYSVEDQIKIITKAKVLAGFDGSAFFTLLFLKNYKGQIKMFNRGKSRICDMFFLMRDKITNLNCEFIRDYPNENLIFEKLKNL